MPSLNQRVLSMILYSVHDNKLNTTTLLNAHDFSAFLMELSADNPWSSYDILFAVDEYGPRQVAERYLLTKHTV